MPTDPIMLRQDIVLKERHGGHDRVFVTKYEAPADTDGRPADDEYKARDIEVAETAMAWLNKHYPGHLWGVVADLRQGIVKINIPILMGFEHWFVINLHTHDIIDGLHLGAGQILECYRIPRGSFQLAPFLEAREQHSILVNRTRKVPT